MDVYRTRSHSLDTVGDIVLGLQVLDYVPCDPACLVLPLRHSSCLLVNADFADLQPLRIGEACDRNSVIKYRGVDPGCLSNGEYFLFDCHS